MPRTARRLALALAGVLLLLALLVGASIPLDGLLGRGRVAALANVRIPAGGTDVGGYLARPSGGGPHPAVLLIHEWWGLNEEIVAKADLLAREGYIVLAPDTFRGATTGWIPRAIYQVSTTPVERVSADLDAAYAWLASRPDVERERIGVVGFCYGGRVGLGYSLRNPALAATVTFYGLATTDPAALGAISGPVLGIFGGADNSISLAEVRALEAGLVAAGVEHQVTVYDGQPHAFVKGPAEIERDPVQRAAWSEMLAFLDESLRRQGTSDDSSPTTSLASHVDHVSARQVADSPPNLLGLALHSLQGH